MEIKRKEKDQVLLHGDVRLPEITDAEARGPSRAKVLLHLTGMGFGFLLLLIGLGMGLSRGIWDKPALIPVIAGGALVLSWLTINYSFIASVVRNRRVMVGTNAVFMGLLALTLLIAVNFVLYRHYRKYDMTIAGKFTLSEKTEKVLADLKKKVEIVTVTLAQRSTGQEEAAFRLKDMLKLYSDRSKLVDVKFLPADLDPTVIPMLKEKYGISIANQNDYDAAYIICGGKEGKRKVVHLREILDYERDPQNPYGPAKPTNFKGEQYITSAILEVTQPKQPKVYFLSGHGEREISDATPPGMMELANNLKRDNLLVETLSGLPSTGVPADCDALVIMAPQATFAPEDIDRVKQYLDRGGRLFTGEDVGKNSGLEQMLIDWGIKVDNDAVISQNAQTALGSPVIFVATDFGDHDITKPLKGFSVIINFGRSVTALPDSTGKHQVTALIESGKASYGETDLDGLFKTGSSGKSKTDLPGPLSLAVASEEVPSGEGGKPANKCARIVVLGDPDAFSNNILTQAGQSTKNLDFARNSVNWLLDRQELIAIDARPETKHVMAVDQAAARAVLIYLVIGMPCLVLLMGGVVWALRSYGSRR